MLDLGKVVGVKKIVDHLGRQLVTDYSSEIAAHFFDSVKLRVDGENDQRVGTFRAHLPGSLAAPSRIATTAS